MTDNQPAIYAIKYRGILSEMWVTGFSEPMDMGADVRTERSVKASNLIADAKVFEAHEVEGAFALARRCQPTAEKVKL